MARRYEFDRAARGMDQVCGTLRTENPVLSFPPPGKAGDHRLGAGELSVWRERRRRDREAEIRSVLYPALFIEARRDDRAEDGVYGALRQRPMSKVGSRKQKVRNLENRGRIDLVPK